VAAFLVFVYHFDYFFGEKFPIFTGLDFIQKGYLWVDFFFVLSGFVISHVYLEQLSKPSIKQYKKYLIYRIARIYPVHIVLLLAFIGFEFATMVMANGNGQFFHEGRSIEAIFTNLTLIHSWGIYDHLTWNTPSWSISAEWFAYILFPLFALAFRWVKNPFVAAGVIAVLVLLMHSLSFMLKSRDGIIMEWHYDYGLIRVVIGFLCGMMVQRMVSVSNPSNFQNADVLSFVAFILVIAAMEYKFLKGDALYILLFCYLIGLVSQADGAFSRVLNNKYLVYLGEVSYSVYLVHLLVLMVAKQALEMVLPSLSGDVNGWLVFVTLSFGVTLAAAILYEVVEKPCRRLIRSRFG
jgi:peptidoglycan/LPS O-acetylase OafA/YrhL